MNAELWSKVRYFQRHEFDSRDVIGSGDKMDIALVFMLDALRGLMDKPFKINSGYRTIQHNKSVGGAPASAHLDGLAVDISIIGWNRKNEQDFIRYARAIGFTGIGIGQTFIHIDRKDRVASWLYVPGGQKAIKVGTEDLYI